MDRTLTAIDGSVDKWKKIVFKNGEDKGMANCPLCIEFLNKSNECIGCPVFRFIQNTKVVFHRHIVPPSAEGCVYTPWIAWKNAHVWAHTQMVARSQKEINLANLELSFLYEVRLWWINRINGNRLYRKIE